MGVPHEVVGKVQARRTVTLTGLDWWDVTRVMILVTVGPKWCGIYMRRRLSSPLVEPFYIEVEHERSAS